MAAMRTDAPTAPQQLMRTDVESIVSIIIRDLRTLQSFYHKPKDEWLALYERELSGLLTGGFMRTVEYGFQFRRRRVLSLVYEINSGAHQATTEATDLPSDINVSRAGWYSYLRWSSKWRALTPEQRADIGQSLPFQRGHAFRFEPCAGQWHQGAWCDHTIGIYVRRSVFCAADESATSRSAHSSQVGS
ncbi:MAG: hypothetical protein Tsb0020_19930 [Haliangiales bacterium]